MGAKKTLAQWIRDQVAVLEWESENTTSQCTALSLVRFHDVSQIGHVEIRGIRISSAKPVNESQLAEFFTSLAETDSQTSQNVVYYAVLSFFAGKETPQGRYPFEMQGASIVGRGGVEPPTPDGERMQRMRQNEGLYGFSLSMVRESFSALLSTNRILSEENNRLRHESIDTLELARETILRQAAASHELKMQELQFARSTEERKKIMQLGPVVINKLFGKDVIPTGTADTSLFEALANDLSPEELTMMLTFLQGRNIKPEIIGLIADRFTVLIEDKRKAEKLAKGVSHGSTANDSSH